MRPRGNGPRRRRRRAEGRRETLNALGALQAKGLPLSLAASGVGLHASTARRWRHRQANGESLVRRRGPDRAVLTENARAEAMSLVRQMRALIGASALSHSVSGLSRRQAAQIKTETCRAIEHERRVAAERVVVSAPGVIRGFDAMDLGGHQGYALIAADGCVPYRTGWTLSSRYDGAAVEDLLKRDFDKNGAPLVLRMDRATQHHVPAVERLLADQLVLVLHGPAYYAPFYGQLERQNHEHRQWLAAGGTVDDGLDAMIVALNTRWRRGTLQWRTAAEAWAARPVLHVDRHALAEEVHGRAVRLRRKLHVSTGLYDLAWRLAIKQALTSRGLLRVVKGGWC